MDKIIENPRRRVSKTLLIFVTIVCLIAAIFFWGSRGDVSYTVAAEDLSFETVYKGNEADFIPINATIRAVDTTFIDILEGGKVEEIFTENGALLTKGQAIVRLSNTNLQLNVIEKEAQITEQISNLYNIKSNLQNNKLQSEVNVQTTESNIIKLRNRIERRKKHADRLGIAEEELKELDNELALQVTLLVTYIAHKKESDSLREIQTSKIEELFTQLNSNLEFTRSTLGSLLISAPIDGNLTGFNIQLGESIVKGTRIGQLENDGAHEIFAMVDEFYLSNVRIGQKATFTVSDRPVAAVVTKVLPQVENGKFEVVLSIDDNQNVPTSRGQNVIGKLLISEFFESVRVKNGPFILDTAGKWVFVVDRRSNTAKRREIEILSQNPEFISIRKGLSAEEEIVSSSYRKFVEYDQIRIK